MVLILNHFRNNIRLLQRLPVSKKQCQDFGAILSSELVRLNHVVFLSLLEHDPFPGNRIPASGVSDTAAIFNAVISGIMRQTLGGKSLSRDVEFFSRCLQLLEAGYVIGMDEIAAQDLAKIERAIDQLEGTNERSRLTSGKKNGVVAIIRDDSSAKSVTFINA
ncbi:unnamed protein product [Hydatigera taeniaeformis]|uniref:Transposase n=1 Tax=Hydatigena taeniaeformis TaxID=6205 RepID=A0A0R3X0A3_HYDTA|nr:unnamed protein product [Hydatigera taeniaeformis]